MLFFILYKIAHLLALICPIKLGYWIASQVADLHYRFSEKDRIAVTENLKAILGADDQRIPKCTKEVFRNFARYLVDFFRFDKIDKAYIEKYVKIEGIENLDSALSQGKGAVGLTAHIGNWELGGAILSIIGYPVIAVALEHKNKLVNELFNRQRRIKGGEVVPVGSAFMKCLKGLKKNKMVALLGDRDFTNHTMRIELLGKPTPIPQGPAFISIKTGAPIVPGFMIREKQGKFLFKLVFEKPIQIQPSQDEAKDVRELTRRYLDVIEKYVKLYPTQWFIFNRFWEPIRCKTAL